MDNMNEQVAPVVNTTELCDHKHGRMPNCLPLAASYVPFQQEGAPKYDSSEALSRGTLFPGLDLPWKNIANTGHPLANTPLGELMSLDFVLHELQLYLDTHENDEEVFMLLKELTALAEEGRERYVERYGPVTPADLKHANSFTWLKNPWPWEYSEGAEG